MLTRTCLSFSATTSNHGSSPFRQVRADGIIYKLCTIHRYNSLYVMLGDAFCENALLECDTTSRELVEGKPVALTNIQKNVSPKWKIHPIYWQFFYLCPHRKFRYAVAEITKMWCQELDIYLYIVIILSIIDMDFLYQFNLKLHHFSQYLFNVNKWFSKLSKVGRSVIVWRSG